MLDLPPLPLGPCSAGLPASCSPWKSLVVNPLLSWTLWFSGPTTMGDQFWIWFFVTSDDYQHGKINLSCERTSVTVCYLISVNSVTSHRAQMSKRTRSGQRSICLRRWPGERPFRDSMKAPLLSHVSLSFPAAESIAAGITAVCTSLPSTFSIFCSWILSDHFVILLMLPSQIPMAAKFTNLLPAVRRSTFLWLFYTDFFFLN